MIEVTKRNGDLEDCDLDKVHKVLEWAAEGLDVSVSQVEMKSHIQFYDGITTQTIHDTLVKTAADLISVDEPDYQYMSARLLMFQLRKEVYGRFEPISLSSHVENLTKKGMYDKHILEDFSKKELGQLDNYIDHSRDLKFSYAGLKQLEGKYLVQNRATDVVYETPQMLYMLVAACLFSKYPKGTRMSYIKKFYDATSLFKISLPTPIMAGVRTPTRQFSSCVLIESGDSLDSISAASGAIIKYVSQRAGIGINAGRIRAEGSSIRNGEAKHTGCIPFYKHFQTAVKSCSQGGVRGGAAALFYPLWHLEVENLLVLKNNRGVEDNRVRHLDYAVQFNKVMYERLIKGGNITLFSPSDVEGLYDAFFEDQQLFEKLYIEAENNPDIRKKVVKAVDVFSSFAQERAGTGRIYLQNVDHCNINSPFDSKKAPIRQSNLCVAPETQILTDRGYIPIADLEDETVNVWNGEEFSETVVRKTGVSQKLVKVVTSSGQELECTPYHKFYIFNGYGKPYVEKRANELKAGDKLAKFDLPIISGSTQMDKSYLNGFYTGDGCSFKGKSVVYLYGEKRFLSEEFSKYDHTYYIKQENQDREVFHMTGLKDKFFVPSEGYNINSRLEWLAGWLDADGCVYRNGDNQQLTGCSTEKGFLLEVQRMLQTLGVSAKLNEATEDGYRKLPMNDGTGESGDFWCKKSWRLLITSCDTYKLMDLGLGGYLKRLKIIKRLPQRDAKQFSKVVSVQDNGRFDDTYCFNEKKRHMGMFNGILTGQCLEIALPTKPLKYIQDPDGEVALCTLSAFNLGEITLDELPTLSDLIVRALDSLLDYQDYPLIAAENSSMNRRTLGVGLINYANYLAKNGVKYSDGSANKLTHQLMEKFQYNLLVASNNLAKEKGACPLFNETTYSQGILPIDRYKSSVDSVVENELKEDWEGLRKSVVEHGLRNSTLSALMPSETSSQVSNATNGIEPPRGYISVKQSKEGILKQVVPNLDILKDNYELLWDIPNNNGYLELVAIMQKFVDQTISANTNYDPSKFSGDKVPMKVLLKDILTAYKLGVKTLYYHNTRDGSNDAQVDIPVEDESCEGGACKI